MKFKKFSFMMILMVLIGAVVEGGEILLNNYSEYEALIRKNKGHQYTINAVERGDNKVKISFTKGDSLEIAPNKYASSWQSLPLSKLDSSYNYTVDIHTDEKAFTPAFIFQTKSTSIGRPVQPTASVFNEEKIDAYLTAHGEASLDDTIVEKNRQIKQWIADGGRYAYHILYNLDFDVDNPDQSFIKTVTQKEYFDVILSLMWYFYAEAINKGQEFEQGSFIVQDTDDRLFRFLHNYVKKMNPTNWKDVAGSLGSQNPYGYTRQSTHLYDSKVHGDDYNHFGIDARYQGENDSIGSVQYILPIYKSHILFGRIFPKDGYKRVFIKPEDYGLYISDGLPMHGYELGFSVARKIFGGDDEDHFRKERVEKALIARMKTIFEDNRSFLNREAQGQFLQQVKLYGVQEVVRLAYALPNGWLKSQIQVYLTELGKKYDHLSWRYGREVILNDFELVSSIYYYLEHGSFYAEAQKLKVFLGNLEKGRSASFTDAIRRDISTFDLASIKPYVTPQAAGAIQNIMKMFQ